MIACVCSSSSDDNSITDSDDESISSSAELTNYNKLRHYNLLNIIGKGSFSSVLLTFNTIDKKFSIIKIHNNGNNDEIMKEIKICDYLKPYKQYFNIVKEYFIENINGIDHICSVWDLCNTDIDKVIRYHGYSNGFSLNISNRIFNQIITAIYYLHLKIKAIHGDIKTDNILIKGTGHNTLAICNEYLKMYNNNVNHEEIIQSLNFENNISPVDDNIINNIEICIADYGTVTRKTYYKSNSFGTQYYSAPEILLYGDMSYPLDIWSIGCVYFELLTGAILFNDNFQTDDFTILSLIHDLCGKYPLKFLNKTRRAYKYFNRNKLLKYKYNENNTFDNKINKIDKINSNENIINIFKNTLTINPKHRWTIKELYENKQ